MTDTTVEQQREYSSAVAGYTPEQFDAMADEGRQQRQAAP